jgi:predicted O-methyltransferase YrrM
MSLKYRLKRILPPRAQLLFHTLNHYRLLQAVANAMGYNISPVKDYYSPLLSRKQLRTTKVRWYKPSALLGVDYSIARLSQNLTEITLRYASELDALPTYERISAREFGPGYNELDGLLLYMMIRDLKSARYLEVGSGVSTYYCALAAARNAHDGHMMAITCIEPYPKVALRSIEGIKILQREVQDESLTTFAELESGDVLFIDSSHTLRMDSDVAYLFLEVLPSLRSGVNIHIHDVPFPYNCPYPPERWVLNRTWPAHWNEAMILQALLCNSNRFEITMSLPLLRFHDEQRLATLMPATKQ